MNSPIKNKRFRVYMNNGKYYDFGLYNGSTFIDHKDIKKRKAYWARHYGNIKERKLIDNLVPSPSLFSAYLLWGEYSDLDKNIQELNKLWNR